ncbi:MAG: J domain-containing protein [Clostridia bacterium]|nr:J domain-containing protein [Clostridia bacterium]
MSKNPYEILGISPSATDDEVKIAYRNLARKYHPDNYQNNPLSGLAEEKMQEINEAYDAIVRMRKGGQAAGNAGRTNPQGGYAGGSRYHDIRQMIYANRLADAETLLDGTPGHARDGEWFFLKGSVLYKKGWLEDAYTHFQTACRMEPGNLEFRQALNQVMAGRTTGGYRTTGGSQGCSGCDVCSGLLCADCCCECMGGDLIRCC